MTTEERIEIRELINRLGRISAAEEWVGDLNPAQRAALSYLARANRFSRAPAQVAEYLSTTRGTASQTLKALERKGYAAAMPSEADKRSIRYDVTRSGQDALSFKDALEAAITATPDEQARTLRDALAKLTLTALAQRGGRAFGVCRTCRHHQTTQKGGFCELLMIKLEPFEAGQLCHEHALA